MALSIVASGTVSSTVVGAASSAGAPAVVATREPFTSSISTIGTERAASMTGVSWHEGCPVALDDLRVVSVPYWGFDDVAHHGELVVHRRVAAAVRRVFRTLYVAQFPIYQMQAIEAFGGNDDASPYVGRAQLRPGMIVRGGVVDRAMRSIGWKWGGQWRTSKDYQHFSSSGR
jgi:D-alanyl-D-alanine carboxypeptidase